MADALAAPPAGSPTFLPMESASTTRWRRPPAWLWPLSIVLQMLSAAALTSYTYFFVDDWLLIAEARRTPLSLAYLREPLFEHFSPVSRLLDKLLIHGSSGSFALAHSLQLLMYAAAVGAFALVIRTILGNRWSAFALTLLFGQSLFLMRLLNWWTATANLLPATVLGLIAIAGYLRWRQGRSPWWLITSLACFLAALLAYEIAMLLPVYIAVVRLLVLEDRLRPRAWIDALRDEWMIWLGFAVLELGAVINYYTGYYLALPHAPVLQTLHFLVIAVFGAFVPALFGIKNPQSSLGADQPVIIACVVVALGLTAYVVYTRPRTWRCVLAFALIAVVTMAPVGVIRSVSFGLHIAKELYYQQSLQFMFLILVALALRTERRRATPRWLAAIGARMRNPMARGSLVAASLLGYGVLYVTSVDAMANASWEPHASRAYVSTFQASVREVRKRTGREPVLFNALTPFEISEGGSFPYNSYNTFFPMVDSHVRFNTVTKPMYVTARSGALMPVSFAVSVRGTLANASVLQPGRSPAPPVRSGGSACVPSGRSGAQLRVPLSQPLKLTAVAHGVPQALALAVRTPTAAGATIAVRGSRASLSATGFPPIFSQGTSQQYVPLDITANARAVDLGLPGGACVESLAIGSFAPIPR